jgi:Bardet-Biedl syndrome 9 protein
VLLLIRCRFSLDDESFDVLRGYLSPVVNDLQDQGWEECTEAAMTHLLRTSLSKNAKEAVGLSTQVCVFLPSS